MGPFDQLSDGSYGVVAMAFPEGEDAYRKSSTGSAELLTSFLVQVSSARGRQ